MASKRRVRSSARGGRTHFAFRPRYRRRLRLEPLEERRLLATVTVNTDQDIVDFNDGLTSLREAIFATNLVGGADTIEFDFGHDGPATILLTQGELLITDDLTISGPGAELLTIDASGNDPTPDENNGDGSRIFSISGDPRQEPMAVRISGLRLTGGDAGTIGGGAMLSKGSNLLVEDVVITDNHALVEGGGIANAVGPLTVVDSTISGNRARRGGAISSHGNDVVIDSSRLIENTATERGGGVFFFRTHADGNLSVTDSTLRGNTVLNPNGHGGAIYAVDFRPPAPGGMNALVITGNTISQNTAAGDGGGIFARITGGAIQINENEFVGNTASNPGRRGGGIYLEVRSATTELTANTLRENSAGYGGGVYVLSLPSGNVPSTVLIDGSRFFSNTATGGQSEGGGITVSGQNIATTIRDSMIEGNQTEGRGGGIFAGGGPLIIESSTISGNTASRFGGGVYATSGLTITDSTLASNVAQHGGAIATWQSQLLHTIEISGSEFAHNAAIGDLGHGGAIHLSARLTITDSTFTGNAATGSGGAIHAASRARQVTIVHSEFSSNSAVLDGGGIANFGSAGRGASLNIMATYFTTNQAGRNGGALFTASGNGIASSSLFANNEAGHNGGAIGVPAGPFTLTNSTLSGNSADAFGGGIWMSGPVTMAHSTVHQNGAGEAGGGAFVTAGMLNLANTIVAGNMAPIGPDLGGFLGTALNPRFSLIGTNLGTGLPQSPDGMPDENGNLIGGSFPSARIDPRLGPLMDNGGDTFTHALLPESPAIDAGDPSAVAGVAGVPTHDQRGEPFTRVFGGRIDIGAFERLPAGFLPGDFSRDGIVDAADYVLWRSQEGMAVDPSTGADGNGDGMVDELDYALWKANFMSTRDDLGPVGPPRGLVIAAEIEGTVDGDEPIRLMFEPQSGQFAAQLVAAQAESERGVEPRSALQRDRALLAWLSTDGLGPESRRESNGLRRSSGESGTTGDASRFDDRDAGVVDQLFETIGTLPRAFARAR